MTNNLPAIPTDNEFQTLQVIARNATLSGLYNAVGNEQKIFMILLAARELGIKPMMALNGGLWNIQGKIEVSARLMTNLIRQAGHSMTVKTINDRECIIEGKRADNGDVQQASFTIEEATRAGLVRSGGNWTKYPQDMLYARALSRLARRLFADVIGTAYVEGEIRESLKHTKEESLETIACEEVKESLEEATNLIEAFLLNYPAEYHEDIKSYLDKYSNHWKKTIKQTLSDYSDVEKFLKDFNKWKNKELSKGKQN